MHSSKSGVQTRFALAINALVVLIYPNLSLANDSSGWPQWRGANQNGVAIGDDYPIEWSEEAGIAWKLPLPGRGGSTPVVSGETAYLTTGEDEKNHVMAVDLAQGTIRWKVAVGEDRGGKHKKGSGSNPSCVVDGDLIFAYFRSGDVGCVDADGKLKWTFNLQDEFGEDSLWWDLGSSPTLTEDAIVLVVMQTGPSYLIALDKTSGEQLWKTNRMLDAPEEAAQSYTTPVRVMIAGQEAIAVMGADHLTLHRADNGVEMARLGGFNPTGHQYFRSIASPVIDSGVVVCPYARGSTLTGVRLDDLVSGQGKESIAWFHDDLGSDVPTPSAIDGRIYVVGDGKQNKGTVTCLDIQTGDQKWSVKLPKSRYGFSSSPLIAGNHLYVIREDATTFVIGPIDSDDPGLVATNEVDDSENFAVASPVPVASSLLLRTRNYLYRTKGP